MATLKETTGALVIGLAHTAAIANKLYEQGEWRMDKVSDNTNQVIMLSAHGKAIAVLIEQVRESLKEQLAEWGGLNDKESDNAKQGD